MLAVVVALALAAPNAPETVPPSPAPAAAAAAAPTPAATPPAVAPADDPLVCKSETPIGTKLPKRTCIKKSERDRQKRESQDALQLIQRRSLGPHEDNMTR